MYRPYIELNGTEPVAISRTRFIYEHPEDSNYLIKVHKPSRQGSDKSPLRSWLTRLEDHFLYISGFAREIYLYIDSRYHNRNPVLSHVAPIAGFVDTDMGFGLVVSAVRDSRGQLAPTLGQLMKQGQLTPERKVLLDQLLDKIAGSEMVLGDLNNGNIVLEQNPDGTEEFFIIDGLGEKTLIPVQMFSRRLRKHKKLKFVNKIRMQLQ